MTRTGYDQNDTTENPKSSHGSRSPLSEKQIPATKASRTNKMNELPTKHSYRLASSRE